MSTASSGLRELHRLHLQLREVQEQLERGPRQIKARRQYVEKKQAELESQQQNVAQLRKTADQKQLQLKTNESKIADLRVKLNAAKSNREFDAIKAQIDADVMANSVLEDEILETLDKVDQAQKAVETLKGELAEAEAEEQRVADRFAGEEPGLKEEADRLEAELREHEQKLPAEVAPVYRRLVQAHGAGALAPVYEKSCTACNTVLSPQERVQLNTGRTTFCRSCGRLLYLEQDEDSAGQAG